MNRRIFACWCVATATLGVFANWPRDSGVGGFFRQAGFPLAFAWGTGGRLHDFDLTRLALDLLFWAVVILGVSWLCARSRGKPDIQGKPRS